MAFPAGCRTVAQSLPYTLPPHLTTLPSPLRQVKLELRRDGEVVTGQVRLVPEPRLVPYHHQVDAFPSYVIVGGLVFVALTLPLVEEGHLEVMPSHPQFSLSSPIFLTPFSASSAYPSQPSPHRTPPTCHGHASSPPLPLQ